MDDEIFLAGFIGLIFILGFYFGFAVNEHNLYPSESVLQEFESVKEYNESMKVSLTQIGSNDTHVLFAQCSDGVKASEINNTNYNSSRIQDNCYFNLEEKPIATTGVEHISTEGDNQSN